MPDEIFPETTKVTVNLNAASMSSLYGLSAELGISRTDALKQALQVYEALLNCPDSHHIEITLPGGETRMFITPR